jgi:hypothetical protein
MLKQKKLTTWSVIVHQQRYRPYSYSDNQRFYKYLCFYYKKNIFLRKLRIYMYLEYILTTANLIADSNTADDFSDAISVRYELTNDCSFTCLVIMKGFPAITLINIFPISSLCAKHKKYENVTSKNN